MKNTNKLLDFWLASTDKQKLMVARRAGTTVNYLRHLAYGYGKRIPNVRLAVGVEHATRALRKTNRKMIVVTCEDLAALSDKR